MPLSALDAFIAKTDRTLDTKDVIWFTLLFSRSVPAAKIDEKNFEEAVKKLEENRLRRSNRSSHVGGVRRHERPDGLRIMLSPLEEFMKAP